MKAEAELVAVETVVLAASRPEPVFGAFSSRDPLTELTTAYRRIVSSVHPDFYADVLKPRANACLLKLNVLRDRAEEKVRAGSYGSKDPAPTIKVGRRTFSLDRKIGAGSISDVYASRLDGTDLAVKVAATSGMSELLKREADFLQEVYPPTQASEKFWRYLPRLTETFQMKGGRRVNVFERLDGYVTLAQVHERHPVLDFRDVVWILKRTFAGVGFAHTKGYAHGALFPDNVMIHPTGHGAVILDWCWSAKLGESPLARPSGFEPEWYGPEDKSRKGPPRLTCTVDTYMIGKLAVYLLGGSVRTGTVPDSPIRGFIQALLLSRGRPDNCWDLHEDLDKVLEKAGVKRQYRPLEM